MQKNIAYKTATSLLNIGAVHHRGDAKPFIFTSGWASPVYIDCRKIISFPKERDSIMNDAVFVMHEIIGDEHWDMIAGGETAGIPFAGFLAEKTKKPMIYIRKKPKGFGRNAQIEGFMEENSKVLLVEDLASDGRSKITFANVIRDAGAMVSDTLVVFHYGIFKGTHETLEKHGIKLHALATWWDVLQVIKDKNYFEKKSIEEIESFLHDPVSWSSQHGGIDRLPD